MTQAPASSPPLFSWLNERSAGVMLHLCSLPSDLGIGNLGQHAYRFVDFMRQSRFRVWQLCPLGPTGFGDSPYQCFSAFAGNPYYIDLDPLVAAGLLEDDDLAGLRALSSEKVDYGSLYQLFWPVLDKAYATFKASKADSVADYGSFKAFRREQDFWLDDYTTFMALKDHFDGAPWLEWPDSYRHVQKYRSEPNKQPRDVTGKAKAYAFYQYLFFAQLRQLREYAHANDVQIMGDAPIFVALDSADVWAHPDLFRLDRRGRPTAVAGVPPDYFSDDGQLWGNPLYQWSKHEADNFHWWVQRIESNLDFYDIVRLDHFRGFESNWSVPAKDTNARNGKWENGPGIALFRAIQQARPEAKLVAEDLGVITDDVRALHEATGLPGMAVMHFAFGDDASNAYLPHNYRPNLIAYSGTHDNDTTIGWYQSESEAIREHVRDYLEVDGSAIGWDLFRSIYKSSARLAIVALQDLMNLGPEARLNRPGAAMGNWQWRFSPEQLEHLQSESAPYLTHLADLYGR